MFKKSMFKKSQPHHFLITNFFMVENEELFLEWVKAINAGADDEDTFERPWLDVHINYQESDRLNNLTTALAESGSSTQHYKQRPHRPMYSLYSEQGMPSYRMKGIEELKLDDPDGEYDGPESREFDFAEELREHLHEDEVALVSTVSIHAGAGFTTDGVIVTRSGTTYIDNIPNEVYSDSLQLVGCGNPHHQPHFITSHFKVIEKTEE